MAFEEDGGGRRDSDGGLSEFLAASPLDLSPAFLLSSSRLDTISNFLYVSDLVDGPD